VRAAGTIFDEHLFAYYEDVDLCARLLEAGWELAVVPEALATHRGSSSAGSLGSDALRLRVRNRWIVHRRHSQVGRSGALLAEDVRHLVRALARGRLGEAGTRVGAVVAGMAGRT
jgi:GT2 family glycosyltransferase